MQCPSCAHEAPQIAFGDPMCCPSCSVYYEKALKAKLSKMLESKPAEGGFKLMADHVKVATRGLEGAQPVVVTDIQMRFWSMMVFMVKWMLASIPALLVFLTILTVFGTIFGGLIAGIIASK